MERRRTDAQNPVGTAVFPDTGGRYGQVDDPCVRVLPGTQGGGLVDAAYGTAES